MIQEKEWFMEWFNSPYYHLLYQNRNEDEARLFISKLIHLLQVEPHHKILDLACGKGRHSIFLNQLGFDVMGIDLSKANIAYANWFANNTLKFRVHDMRQVVKPGYFDFVLNLFTSFGYFEREEDNEVAIMAAAENLKPGGCLVLDFMNTPRVIEHLVAEEAKILSKIPFRITRHVEGGYILKDIYFRDNDQDFHYQERVKAITEEQFRHYFEAAGLSIVKLAGSYELSPYEASTSDRMIFVAQRA
jgi:SAM-dependent methyltransferase